MNMRSYGTIQYTQNDTKCCLVSRICHILALSYFQNSPQRTLLQQVSDFGYKGIKYTFCIKWNFVDSYLFSREFRKLKWPFYKFKLSWDEKSQNVNQR
jgi:hypothetical protein